jgi:hypothetical protein
METNNQNLPPVPMSPKDYSSNHSAPSSSVLDPSLQSSKQQPLFSDEMAQKIDYIDQGVSKEKNKKAVVLAIGIMLIFFAIYGVFIAKALRKDAKNIEVSGDQVSMTWKGMNISAKLAPRKTIAIMTNGGQMDSRNDGNFMVIPMEKVKYLEQKYTDFTHCGSPGEAEAISLYYPIEIFANSASSEMEMSKVNDLVKKGNLVVFEVDGSQLQQTQINQSGKNLPMGSNFEIYLVDNVRIIKEKYQ